MESLPAVANMIESITYGHGEQRLIPGICFNTSGVVTKWIFAARNESSLPDRKWQLPELQIWRRIEALMPTQRSNTSGFSDVPSVNPIGRMYMKINGTTPDVQLNNAGRLNVYEYIVNMPFQAGDILGIYQPDMNSSQLSLSFVDNGPANYIYPTPASGSTISTVLDLDDAVNIISNAPLVTVEAMVQIGKRSSAVAIVLF